MTPVTDGGVWFFSPVYCVRPRRGRGGTLISSFFLDEVLAYAR